MPPYLSNGRLTIVKPPSAITDVATEERTSAIDFVNRQNYIFQQFNHDRMLETFLPDAVVYHSEGTLRGHATFRKFFEAFHARAIPGVCRSATNHIVDRDDDGETGMGITSI
ncbi:hypothetical protein BJX64DRAFT_282984 [Aspergillus heterothallicus]